MMSSTRKITLNSSDGKSFEVDEAVVQQSQTIKHMIENDGADNGILPVSVPSRTLALVIRFCEKHFETPKAEGGAADDELKNWDAEFVRVNVSALFDLMRAANYLNIKGLQNLTHQTVADAIKRMTPDEIIEIYSILKGITPEENEELCQGELAGF